MPRPYILPNNFDEAVKAYRDGLTLDDVVRRFGRTAGYWRLRFWRSAGIKIRRRGWKIPAKRKALDEATIVASYAAGKSVKSIAKDLSILRSQVRRCLRENGIKPANRSESMFRRMRQTAPQERKRLAAKAHIARRNMVDTNSACRARAATNQRRLHKVGIAEREVLEALVARGLQPIWQKAIDRYNVDIGLAPVAVEIHTLATHPFCTKSNRRKIEYLRERGWGSIWIWARRGVFITSAIDEVVAFYEQTSSLAAGLREHRVIRGDGKLAPAFKPKAYQWTAIPSPHQTTDR